MCAECAYECNRQRSGKLLERASENFRNCVITLGGTVSGIYAGNDIRVKCICPVGHVCYPKPKKLTSKGHFCPKCTGRCPIQAEENFRNRIATLGAQIIGKYRNVNVSVKCVCNKGHICYPRPSDVTSKRQQGICLECVGLSPEVSLRNFRASLSEAGFIMLANYTNSCTKVMCKCPAGHFNHFSPDRVKQKGVSCKQCVGYASYLETITAEALKYLGYNFESQVSDPNIRRLTYDFKFVSGGVTYYIEADGEQHQRDMPFFH